jgi:metabotropic glutamate receptor 2/3/metabotropic glutamate receptor 6/7/8
MAAQLRRIGNHNSVYMTLMLGAICFANINIAATAPVFDYGTPSETLNSTDGRIRGARNREGKAFVLGGLFPIHSDEGGGRCGAVREERGLERMEAMLFAIDKVNSDPSLLKGLQIGYDIRDTCNSENIGLDETIDLIITGSQLNIESCQSATTISTGVNRTDDSTSFVLPSPTVGLVGAASSQVSVPVASLARLFQMPQVSYASSSAILSNRDRYSFFYRTIPPDNLQARAMIDILLRFNWTYVSTIYSRNPYGEPGIDEFQRLANKDGICIDLNEGIEENYSPSQYDDLVRRLTVSQANVVVIFASQDIAEEILTRLSNTTNGTRFQFIASDAWARSINVVHQANETAAGLFGIVPLTEHVNEFEEYFSSLTIESNQRNPWFSEFYKAFANCTLEGTGTSDTRLCAKNRNITQLPRYQQGNFIPLVIDAVYTFAKALNSFLLDNCDTSDFTWFPDTRTCAGQTRELNGSALLEYISQVNVKNNITGNNLLFDSQGNVESMYEILNYQARPSKGGGDNSSARFKYSFRRVGVWDSSVVNDSNLEALDLLAGEQVQFGVNNASNGSLTLTGKAVISQCTVCSPGQYRRVGQSDCCGFCDPCTDDTYSNSTTAKACFPCPNGTWGNNPANGSTECIPIPESFLSYGHPYSIVIVIVAILGLTLVLATVIIFAIFWKTPVVKSSGREQMILLLIGIACSFILAFFFVAPPHPAVCAIQRIGLWFSFSLIFGSLMVKIVRVARIFLRKVNLSRPRFTEPIYQVLFTFCIVAIQLLIILVSLLVTNPDIDSTLRRNANMPSDIPQLVITCIPENVIFLVLSIGYETLILIVATVLGGLSFKYPENFNEAKYIAFCMFAILVIWIAFIITYIATQSTQELQNIAVSLAVVMSGFAVLICIFGPKVFIVLFQPNRNTTDSFNKRPSTDLALTTIAPGTPTATVGLGFSGSSQKLDSTGYKRDNSGGK